MIFRNAFWAILGKISILSINFIFNIFFARIYGPSNYGIYQYILSITNIANVIISFGMPNILVREFVKTNRKNTLISTIIIFRLVLSMFVVLFFTIYFNLVDYSNKYFLFIYMFSLFTNILNFLQYLLIANLMNKENTLIELSKVVIALILRIIFLYFKVSILYFFIVYLVETLLHSTFLLSYIKNQLDLCFVKPDIKILKYLIRESFPLLLSSFAIILYNEVDKIMINSYLGTFSVGQYAAVSKIVLLLSMITQGLNQAFLPYFVRLKKNNSKNYQEKLKIYFDIITWSSIFILAIFYLNASAIIELLYGQDYNGSVIVFKLLLLKGFFSVMSITSGTYMIVENIQKYAYYRNILGLIINVILNILLIEKYGILGAAISTVISMSISSFLSHYFIKIYKIIFILQLKSLFFGYMSCLKSIKYIIRKQKK